MGRNKAFFWFLCYFSAMDRERISRYSSVVVPTYFKVYESKKSLSSILKLYARRLARWFSCGTLIAECHSINNLQIWSENMASKQDIYSVLEAVCLLDECLGCQVAALGEWEGWGWLVSKDVWGPCLLALCAWLSASGCLHPVVCLRLSAVQWIVVASFQCQCLQLLMVLPVIQCCLQCSQFLGRKQKTESTKMVTTITITISIHYILYILIKLRTK